MAAALIAANGNVTKQFKRASSKRSGIRAFQKEIETENNDQQHVRADNLSGSVHCEKNVIEDEKRPVTTLLRVRQVRC